MLQAGHGSAGTYLGRWSKDEVAGAHRKRDQDATTRHATKATARASAMAVLTFMASVHGALLSKANWNQCTWRGVSQKDGYQAAGRPTQTFRTQERAASNTTML